MPIVNFCKKCNREVPPEESCPICGHKLTKTGLQHAFVTKAVPLKDWFCWSGILRIWIPIWLLATLIPPLLEYLNQGVNGFARLIGSGFFFVMLIVMAASLILIAVVLFLQGEEIICYTLNADGVQARSYLNRPKPVHLKARLLSQGSLDYLMKGETRIPAQGLVLIRRDIIPWERVRKVKCWRHGCEILLYRPKFWRILTIHCPGEEYDLAEEYLRTRMRRFKKAKVYPIQIKQRKRKSS